MHASHRHALAAALGGLFLASACGRRETPAPATQAPAKAAPRPGETTLATVTLSPEAEKRLGIELAPVEERVMPETFSAPGEVVVPTGGSLVLSAPFAATVSADAAGLPKAGAAVKRGQTLLRLSPFAPPDRDLRAQTEKSVSVAAAKLAGLDARVARLEKLLAEGGASEKQLEEARSERAVLAAELTASTKRAASLRSAPLEADVSITLRAPRDGLVRSVSVAPGQLVSAGAPLFELLGAPALWVRASVYAAFAERVPPEASARVVTLGASPSPERVAVALPVPAPPSADPTSAQVDLWFELPAGSSRRPGERVSVFLSTNHEASARVVPWSSIVFDAVGGAWVYVETTEHAYERRRVDLARVEGDLAVLERGPSASTRVVRAGASQLFGVEFGVGK